MKIKSIEAKCLKVPRDLNVFRGTAGTPGTFSEEDNKLNTDYSWTKEYSILYSRKIESLVVKITTDDGMVGWGEAQVPICPEAPQAIVNQVLLPLLYDQDPLDIQVLWHRMYNSLRGRGHRDSFMMDAMAAVDIALWDIAGKYYAKPVYKLLGGAFQNPVPVYHSGLPGETIEDKVQNAHKIIEQGYAAIKIYIGKGVEQDLKLLRTLRNAIGYDIKLMVDTLWMYNIVDALRLGAELEKLDIYFLESPTAIEDVEGRKKLSESLKIAIADGESERTRYQIYPYIQQKALDIIQPDIGRTGISEGRRILEMAQTHNIPATIHMAIGQSIYVGASAQMAAATPNLIWLEMNPIMFDLASTFQMNPWPLQKGHLFVPDLPGLGVDVNEDRLNKFVV